jgi:hypothetical protein
MPLTTPAASAAMLLLCHPQQIGPCVRACGGVTARYGSSARTICPACQAEETAADTAQQRG